MFRTKITFQGLNLTRTLNLLSAKYTLFDIKRQKNCCQITVKSGVIKQVVAFLEERCYNIIKVESLGIQYAKEYFKTHFLLPVFALLFVAITVVSSNFCWKIQIDGDYSREQVTAVLNQNQVRIGSNLHNLNVDYLENRLSIGLDAMYAVVQRKGSTLYINAVQKKQVDPPIQMNKRRDLVSTVSGKVTKLLCEQGTPAVKVGDVVKTGDVLIWGQRVMNDGTAQNVYALGKITVEPQLSVFQPFSGTVLQKVQTGNTFSCTQIVLWGKTYGEQSPFDTYEVQTNTVSLAPINLTVQQVTYYETVTQIRVAQIEECQEQLKQQALHRAMSLTPFQIKRTEYVVTTQGVTVTVFGETEIC